MNPQFQGPESMERRRCEVTDPHIMHVRMFAWIRLHHHASPARSVAGHGRGPHGQQHRPNPVGNRVTRPRHCPRQNRARLL